MYRNMKCVGVGRLRDQQFKFFLTETKNYIFQHFLQDSTLRFSKFQSEYFELKKIN